MDDDDPTSIAQGFARRDREFAGWPVGPIDKLEDAGRWHPIETAPKDGREVLITTAGDGMLVRVGFWDEARGGVWSIWPGRDQMRPTHWMPLPKSPASKS